jgi:hypothetical protein
LINVPVSERPGSDDLGDQLRAGFWHPFRVHGNFWAWIQGCRGLHPWLPSVNPFGFNPAVASRSLILSSKPKALPDGTSLSVAAWRQSRKKIFLL